MKTANNRDEIYQDLFHLPRAHVPSTPLAPCPTVLLPQLIYV